MRTLIVVFTFLCLPSYAATAADQPRNCGGSHFLQLPAAPSRTYTFFILGEDGPEHLLLDHAAGPAPRDFQVLLRVKVNEAELNAYRDLLKRSTNGLSPSLNLSGATSFCLRDLPSLKSAEIFPLRAKMGGESTMVIEREDVEILLHRYLPAFLNQSVLRRQIKERGSAHTSILSLAPIRHDEPATTASRRSSYMRAMGSMWNGQFCPAARELRAARVPMTRHAFLLLGKGRRGRVLASHLYDYSPQNFQTVLSLDLTDEQMDQLRAVSAKSKSPVLFLPEQYFCMADLKDLLKHKRLSLSGSLHVNSDYVEFRAGEAVGKLNVVSGKFSVVLNRALPSLLNPQAVARDVFRFVDVQTLAPAIRVETRYSTDWNFIGKRIDGYRANRCYLTERAARALAAVQRDVAKKGLALLALDCYRPQRAVDEFGAWTRSPDGDKMKEFYFQGEDRAKLIERGYIASKSGHSRGSTIDLTLVEASKTKDFDGPLAFKEFVKDCANTAGIERSGQLDMGTTHDCFSERSNTQNPSISSTAKKNRLILKEAMEKQGFINYEKEWWHYTLKDEPYKSDYFDFEVD